jgi:hypothetical protein
MLRLGFEAPVGYESTPSVLLSGIAPFSNFEQLISKSKIAFPNKLQVRRQGFG